jgi:hypothetical protein
MLQTSKIVMPYDPAYTGHRDAERRRKETRAWLEKRERELGFFKDAPSVVPESKPGRTDKKV